jgi:hypothetical protein
MFQQLFQVFTYPFKALKRIIQQDVYNFLRLTEFSTETFFRTFTFS